MTTKLRDTDIRYYEGLVQSTSKMYSDLLRTEREDLEQVLRFRIWRALEAFTSTRWVEQPADAKGRSPRERFVFFCLRNQIKDLVKGRVRRDNSKPDWMDGIVGIREVHIERLSDAALDPYLAVQFEDRFDDEVLLPTTLSSDERQVVVLLYLEYTQVEIARLLRVRARDIGARMAAIRLKMADWRPDVAPMSQGVVKVQLASEAWAVLEAAA